MPQTGGTINLNTGPNNPFTVQEKPIQEPQYKQSINSPKKNYTQPSKLYKEKNSFMKDDSTATINVYSQPQPKPQGIPINQSPYLPFSMSHHNPSGFPKLYNPYGPKLHDSFYDVGGEHALPIGFIKNYNIFADNIHDYQTKMMPIIYEDSIPMRGAKHELTTLSERILLYEYIKNNLVSYEEGEEGCMNQNRGNNLLKQLKYLSPHPVNFNVLYKNPLQGLRKGLRIYRSCYPITTDRTNKTICQKGSLGIHIRFYKKEYFDDELTKHSGNNTITNMKRELEFYIWIRNNILLKKVCPNFTMLYTYNKCFTCNELFNELDKSKIVRPMPAPFTLNMKPKNVLKSTALDFNKSCLVVISEAPNMNILEWMSNTRSYGFNKKVQNNYGYHSKEVWYSIYFQIWAALYTLQQNNIYINNFDYDNIWIKILPEVGYWIYNIDNIKYYVPNCGFLVMIDCGFKEKVLNNEKPCIISSRLFGSDTNYRDETENSTFEKCQEMWDNIINSDPFGRGLVNASVRLPPPEILDMIKQCYEQKTIETVQDRFLNHMSTFLHNRIGTNVFTNELQNIDITSTNYLDLMNYRRGELVIYINDINNNIIWGLYLGDNKILINKNSQPIQISESDIRKSNLTNIEQSNTNSEFMINYGNAPLAEYNLG